MPSEQREATTAALIAAARELFAQRGYADVGTEEIVQRAGVTRGALYQRFRGGKEELFRAVLVQVSAETTRAVMRAASAAADPWQALVIGVEAFLDASVRPEVQRIMLVDGPAVLGWDVWRAADSDYALGLLEQGLQAAIDAGRLIDQPARALAHVLVGALDEAAMVVARAEDPQRAREEMGQTVRQLLEGLRGPGADVLLRETERGVIAIGQPSHAWISGQLARGWGAEQFGRPEPWEEVCLAAEQHDVGMATWDLEPTRNPDTGLPHSFIEMPLRTHLELWRAAAPRLLEQSRYAALLVSMHGMRLYKRRDLDRLDPPEADEVVSFLRAQREFQDQLLATLRDDPATAPSAAPEVVKRNSDLIWAWDYLSLALCLDWAPCASPNVPTKEGPVKLELTPVGGDALLLRPWPLAEATLTLRCEGRRLNGRFETDQALSEAIAGAPWETVAFELRSA